jgi:hypothetical protein
VTIIGPQYLNGLPLFAPNVPRLSAPIVLDAPAGGWLADNEKE